jgi:hypothetical protein
MATRGIREFIVGHEPRRYVCVSNQMADHMSGNKGDRVRYSIRIVGFLRKPCDRLAALRRTFSAMNQKVEYDFSVDGWMH